jgi:hypothetical protein
MILALSAFGIFVAVAGFAIGTLVVGGAFGGEIISAACWVLAGLGLISFL